MRALVLCTVVLLLASIAGAQQLELKLSGAGARAEGLGRAFVGVADDATAIVWNPGGLGQLERPEASVVVRSVSEKFDYENARNPDWNETSDQSHFAFNFGSFAYPIAIGSNNLVLAVAYQKQIDLYSKEETEQYSFESKGGANTITPGVAMRFGSVFGVGASTNIWTGSSEEKYVDKTPPSTTDETKYKFSGTNFVAGVMVDLSGLQQPIPVKFGATIRTPFDLSVKIDDLPDAELVIQMPMMIGIGTSVRIGDSFLIAADFETMAIGGKKFQYFYQGQLSGEDDIADLDKSLNQIRVGAEYLVVLSGGLIPLRAGFHTVPTIYANFDWDGADYVPKDQVVGNGFSVGTGFITGSFALDAAFSVDSYKQEFNDPALTPTLDASQKYTVSKISISGIIYF